MNNKTGLKIPALVSTDVLVISLSPLTRIEEEQISAMRLASKRNFKSRYDLAIRGMLIPFLKYGYDVAEGKIHTAFRQYLTKVGGLSNDDAGHIIRSRHDFKYSGKNPDELATYLLEKILYGMDLEKNNI